MFRPARLLVILLLPLVFPVSSGLPGEASANSTIADRVWTLPQAIATARQNAPTARIAEARVARAATQVQQARGAFFPRVDLESGYSATTAPNMAFGMILNQEEFDNSIDFNEPGQIDNLRLAAVAKYRVYAGGSRSARLEAAKAGSMAAAFAEQSALLELEYAVTESWFVIRQAQALMEARRANVEALQASLKVARAEFEAGTMLKTEMLNLEVQLSQAREQLVNARAALDLAKAAFIRVVGLEGEPEKVRLSPNDVTAPAPPETETLLGRPDLLAAKAAVEAARKQVRAAAGQRLPRVDAFASVQQDHGYDTGGTGESWMAGVNVTLNVFSGGEISAEVAEAKTVLVEAVEDFRQQELVARFQLRRAKLAREEARERLEVTQQAVEQARESADLSRARFEEGTLLASDLIDVEQRLTAARVSRAVAESRLKIAVADLRRALGLSQLEQTAPSPGK